MAAVPVATVLAEAGLAAALAPLMPLIGGTAVLGIVSWKLVAWWKASTAAAAAAAAAAKAAAVEAAAVAAAAAEVAAAEAAALAAAAAPAAAEAAVGEVVGVVATVSTPVLLVGGVVILAVIGGACYLHSRNKKKKRDRAPKVSSKPSSSSGGKDPNDNNQKKILIPKAEMEKLLKEHGKEIRKKLRVGLDKVGTVWKNDDYRVDVGIEHKPNTKNWDLQVNKEASNKPKSLIEGGRGTHKKLFSDEFNPDMLPDEETWKQNILRQFDK